MGASHLSARHGDLHELAVVADVDQDLLGLGQQGREILQVIH